MACSSPSVASKIDTWSSDPVTLKNQIKEYSQQFARARGDATLHHIGSEYYQRHAYVMHCKHSFIALKAHLLDLAKKTEAAVVTRGQLFARNAMHLTPLQVATKFSPQETQVIEFLKGQEVKIRKQLRTDLAKYDPLADFMKTFDERWSQAAAQQDWKTLTELVRSDKLNFASLYDFVKISIRYLTTEFDGAYDQRANETNKVLEAVAKLTGSTFEMINQMRGSTYLKELVHALGKIKNVGAEDLQGWYPAQFLPMHMVFLMRHAVALKSGWYEDGRLPDVLIKGENARHRLHDVLAREIANEVLTYHCNRIALALNALAAKYPQLPLEKMHALFNERSDCSSALVQNPERIVKYTFEKQVLDGQNTHTGWITPDLTFVGQAREMSSDKTPVRFVTNPEDTAYLKRQKEMAEFFVSQNKDKRQAIVAIYQLFQTHARMVCGLIKALNTNNPEFSYSTGCITHSVESSFVHDQISQSIVLRIDNRGLWYNPDSDPNKAISKNLGIFDPSLLDRQVRLAVELYVIRLACALVNEKVKAEKMIYEPPVGMLTVSSLPPFWLNMDLQAIGNCVHASHMVSMLQRFKATLGDDKARVLCDWLGSAEVVFSTTAEGVAMIGGNINARRFSPFY